jgi:hypothetical protein
VPVTDAFGAVLDPTSFLRIHRAVMWQLVLQHHQDPLQDGALVIGEDMDPDFLEL